MFVAFFFLSDVLYFSSTNFGIFSVSLSSSHVTCLVNTSDDNPQRAYYSTSLLSVDSSHPTSNHLFFVGYATIDTSMVIAKYVKSTQQATTIISENQPPQCPNVWNGQISCIIDTPIVL